MTILDEKTVVVLTAAELKTVLEGNNGYTYVYFGADIRLTTGITISSTKSQVTIDGTYQGVRYSYEDMNSTGSGDTISVRSAAIQLVTVKNMNVTGHNYYGLIYVVEDNALRNVVIEYNNLVYKGPQITYHPTGLSRYIDCNITILTSYSAANEVAECNRIEIGGTTIILHTSTGDSSFWFRGSTTPYFKILARATVTITSQSRELFYGVTNLTLAVLEQASFTLTTKNGVGYGTYSTNNVLLDKNASLFITQTAQNGTYPTWYCNGPFVMNEGSTLHMTCNYSLISTFNYCLSFVSTNASLTLNNPKEVILYNQGATAIYSAAQMPFQFQVSRINLWILAKSFAEAGTLDDLPSFAWFKSEGLTTIAGTITSLTTTVVTHNLTDAELKLLPALTNFSFQGKKIISIGSLSLCIDAISDQSVSIKGYTEADATVEISYLTAKQRVTADENGVFTATLPTVLPVGTTIQFLANAKQHFIYQKKQVQIVYPGELTLNSVPQTIRFLLTPFSTNPVLCPRSDSVAITVTDTRITSSNWKLYASINHNLSSVNGYVLTNSLINRTADQTITPLSTTPLLIYTGQNNNGTTKITTITWPEQEGILLRVANEPLENGEEYTATITWTLEE